MAIVTGEQRVARSLNQPDTREPAAPRVAVLIDEEGKETWRSVTVPAQSATDATIPTLIRHTNATIEPR